jgi:hypothetical protein
MIQFILNIIIKTNFGLSIFSDIFSVASLGSAIMGSLLLITRTTFKGFLAANSIISWGILCLSISSNFQVNSL